ncbi:MAG: hypothetical protein PVI30_03635 [Myxococcales bacterium]|jgi:hypothetical protein
MEPGDEVPDETAPAESQGSEPPPRQAPETIRNHPEFQRLGRALKVFLWPFLFSWIVAYAGSARGMDWLHFVGLGGVGLCMLGLLVWLIS